MKKGNQESEVEDFKMPMNQLLVVNLIRVKYNVEVKSGFAISISFSSQVEVF